MHTTTFPRTRPTCSEFKLTTLEPSLPVARCSRRSCFRTFYMRLHGVPRRHLCPSTSWALQSLRRTSTSFLTFSGQPMDLHEHDYNRAPGFGPEVDGFATNWTSRHHCSFMCAWRSCLMDICASSCLDLCRMCNKPPLFYLFTSRGLTAPIPAPSHKPLVVVIPPSFSTVEPASSRVTF